MAKDYQEVFRRIDKHPREIIIAPEEKSRIRQTLDKVKKMCRGKSNFRCVNMSKGLEKELEREDESCQGILSMQTTGLPFQ